MKRIVQASLFCTISSALTAQSTSTAENWRLIDLKTVEQKSSKLCGESSECQSRVVEALLELEFGARLAQASNPDSGKVSDANPVSELLTSTSSLAEFEAARQTSLKRQTIYPAGQPATSTDKNCGDMCEEPCYISSEQESEKNQIVEECVSFCMTLMISSSEVNALDPVVMGPTTKTHNVVVALKQP